MWVLKEECDHDPAYSSFTEFETKEDLFNFLGDDVSEVITTDMVIYEVKEKFFIGEKPFLINFKREE